MHHRHIWLEHLDKPTMAEHSINLGHHIQLHNTSILHYTQLYELHLQGGS
jgi:hypothetical protein